MENKFDKDKYYIEVFGWKGCTFENFVDIINTKNENNFIKEYTTKEEVIQEIKRLWDEELTPDECVGVYYKGDYYLMKAPTFLKDIEKN